MSDSQPPPTLFPGARTGTRDGREVVVAYTEPRSEADAWASGAIIADLSHRERLALTGGDRARFLHGQCSNEVSGLAAGEGRQAFILDNRGTNLAHVHYALLEDRILLECLGQEAVGPRLARFTVIEDVTLTSLDAETCSLLVSGARAREILTGVLPRASLPVSPGSVARGRWGDVELVVRSDAELAACGWHLQVPRDLAPGLWTDLRRAGATPVGHDAWDLLRAHSGHPLHGRDYDARCLPEETGLGDPCISFNKGCYVGQEQVAMQHNRGRLRRIVRGLLPQGPGVARGATVHAGAKHLGQVSSAAPALAGAPPRALALLEGVPEPGLRVELRQADAPSVPAEVVSLPF